MLPGPGAAGAGAHVPPHLLSYRGPGGADGPAQIAGGGRLRVRTAAGLGIAPFFMGNGSNLLAPDEGVDRFLIKSVPGLEGCQVQGTQLLAGAGHLPARLAAFARDEGLTGLEFAHGIPGSWAVQ